MIKLEFRESVVSLGKTEVKQDKFVEFISSAKGYFRSVGKIFATMLLHVSFPLI